MDKINTVVASVVLLLGLLLAGCMQEGSPPPDLIDEDTYIDLLVEMQLVKSYQERIIPDSSSTDGLIPKIMEHYGVTEDQFRRSHLYYQDQISEQQKRISEAIDRLHSDKYTRESSPEESIK